MFSTIRRHAVRLLGGCVMMLAFGSLARAQQTVNTASISGRVTDATGAVLVGARVSVRQTDTNLGASAVTDGEGRFRFIYLQVGPYEITVESPGFETASRKLTLTVGSAFDVPIPLSIQALQDTVSVSASSIVLEAARSQIASTVSREEVRTLPLNGRNFLDVALVAPAVSLPNLGSSSTQLFAETSAVPGSGVSVASQRNLSNNFLVDGLSSNDDAAALTGMTYSVDALDQFQVITSGGQAELGRALGGYMSIVTRSGTNVAHGDAYGYFRDDSLNAANPLSGTTLPMDQQQFGATVGGPIVRNRTFYFTNIEQRSLDQSGLVTVSQANVDTVNAALKTFGYPGQEVTTGVYPNPVDTTNLIFKVDHEINNRDRFSARYSLYRADSTNSRGAGAMNAPSASAGLDNIDQTMAVGNVLTLSSRTLNETRAQFAYSDLKALPTDLIGPAVSISSVVSFGTLSGSPHARVNKMFQVVNNLSHQAGPHALRAGVDFLYNDDTITFPRTFRGQYSFTSMNNFLAGTYSTFAQTFGDSAIHQTNPNLGVYVQDEWKVVPDLTLNLGLRYDLQFLETISTDTNNLSPRAGFAWSPFGSRRTVIRGSSGLFFDRVPLRAVANALLSAANTTDPANLQQYSVSLTPTQSGAPVFPSILGAPVPLLTLTNITTMDREIQNAYSSQASIEVERQLWARTTVSVGYDYIAGRNLIMSINQNVPTCAAAGTNNGCRPNSNYANNPEYSSEGSSDYDGLRLSFMTRPGRWGYYRVSYTLSKAMNNLGETFFTAPFDPGNLGADWGRSDDDQRHRLVVSGSVNSPMEAGRNLAERLTHGWLLSGFVQSYSALPVNIVNSSVQTIQGTTARPIVDGEYIERNAGESTPFFSLNLRASRSFGIGRGAKVEALIEAFNVTNHTNVLARDGNFGPGAYPTNPLSTFNRVTAVGEPRSFQFGVRVGF